MSILEGVYMNLYIKELKVINFKTHKNARIKFSPGINVITGPNGSGKSNIIEAILFGLGERNPRKFRVTSFDQLINKSVKEKYLSTTLTICYGNTDHQFKRVITIDGKHKYYYNGKRVSRTTYLTQLLKLGSEGFNYRYVPQGSVLAAASMTPQELRRLIDDILGITEYNERRGKAIINLEKARIKLQTIKEKSEIIRKNIENLFNQMIDFKREQRINEFLSFLEAVKYTKFIKDRKMKIQKLEKSKKALEDKINQLKLNKEELEGRLKFLMDEKQKLEREKEITGGEKYREMLKRQSSLQAEINAINSEINIFERRLTEVIDYIKEGRKDIEKIERRKKEAEKKIKLLENVNKSLLNEQQRLVRRLKEANILEEEVSKKLKSEERELSKLLRKPDLRVKKALKIFIDLATVKERHEMLEEEINHVKRRIKAAIEAKELLDSYILEMKKEKERINKEIDKLTENKQKISINIKKMSEEIKRAETLYRFAEKEILKLKVVEKLSTDISDFKDALFMSEVAKNLGIKNYISMLYQKIRGPKEIIDALKFILGRRWYSLLVRDQETARVLSELALKYKKKIIVISLDRYINKEKDIPKYSILNYIKYPEYLKGLLTELFKNIIVVDSLPTAFSKILEGYDVIDRKLRFYSYKGDLYIGKKIIYKRGVEKLPQFENILKEFKRMLQLRKKDLKDAINKYESITEKIMALKMEIKSINEIISASSKTGIYLKRVLESYKDRLRVLKDRDREAKEMIREKEKKISFKQLLNKTYADIERGISELKNEINKILDEKQKLNSQITNLRASIKANVDNINRHKELITNLFTPQLSILKNKLEEYIKEKEELINKIKHISRRRGKLIREYSIVTREIQKYEEEVIMLNKKIKKIDREINRINNKINSISTSLIELTSKIGEIQRVIGILNSEIKAYLQEIINRGYEYPVEAYNIKIIEDLIEKFRGELGEIGATNPLARRNYLSDIVPYKQYSLKIEELIREERAILKFIEEIDDLREKILLEGINKINDAMNKIFSKIFGDSKIYLELENPDDIDSGLNLIVEFKDKPRLPVSSLSGGEKSMVLATFLIAINSINMDTILLLDEIDAHIDPRNLDKFATALKDEGTKGQIILVSLKPPIIEISDVIIGVTIRDGISKTLILPKQLIKVERE